LTDLNMGLPFLMAARPPLVATGTPAPAAAISQDEATLLERKEAAGALRVPSREDQK
jgi:hypothetical protein